MNTSPNLSTCIILQKVERKGFRKHWLGMGGRAGRRGTLGNMGYDGRRGGGKVKSRSK